MSPPPSTRWLRLKEETTSQELLDVPAGVRGGELVDNVQRRLVVGVPDVDVDTGLQEKASHVCQVQLGLKDNHTKAGALAPWRRTSSSRRTTSVFPYSDAS